MERPHDCGVMIRRLCTAAILVVIALSFIVAIGSTVLSYWPLEEVKARLDAMAPDGSADDFPLSRIAGIRWKLRVFASVTAILGVLLVALRRRLMLRMCELSGAALGFLQYVRGEARRQWARESRLDIATLLTVTFVALLVRVAFLGQPMRTDEATTFIEFVSKPLVFGLAYYPAPNNHLFHTALAHASFVVFGGQEWAIRLPALLAGVLVVPAAYVVAGMYYGRVAAPIAATLVAVSSPLILYSTNARGYTLLCLFVLLLLIVAGCLVSSNSSGAWVFFVVVAVLGLFTIPIMAFAVGVSAVWIVSERMAGHGTKPLKGVPAALIATGLFTLVLYAPALVTTGSAVFSDQALARSAWYHDPAEAFRLLGRIWTRWNADLPMTAAMLTSGAVVVALVRHQNLGRHRVSIGSVTLLCWLPMLLALPGTPYTRIFLFLLPIYWILAAAGISAFAEPLARRAPVIGRAIVAGLCIAGSAYQAFSLYREQTVYWANDTGALRDAPAVAAYLKDQLKPGDRVAPDAGGHSILAYYFYRETIPLDHIFFDGTGHARTIYVIRRSAAGRRIRELAGEAQDRPRYIKEFRETLLYEVAHPPRE